MSFRWLFAVAVTFSSFYASYGAAADEDRILADRIAIASNDWQRLFINFRYHDAVYTTALNLGGKQLWQKKIADYKFHQGYGSSPTLYGPLVVVSADNKSGGVLKALDRATGTVVWQQQRPKSPNYTSPIVLPIDGRDQIVIVGCNLVVSFDPLTGKKLWETGGATLECVTSTVTDGKLIFYQRWLPRKPHLSDTWR